MKITVRAQILPGNMGEGWHSNNLAAKELARLCKTRWRMDLSDYMAEQDEEVELSFDIDVPYNCSGTSYETTAIAVSNSGEVEDVTEYLTDMNLIFEDFCQ
jgi:hypothetical protein